MPHAHRGRRILAFVVLSLGLHLLLLLVPRPGERPSEVQRFRVHRLPRLRPPPPYSAVGPSTLEHALQRLAPPAFTLPGALHEYVPPVAGGVPGVQAPPPTLRDSLPQARPWVPPARVEMPDLNRLALETLRRQAAEKEEYVYHLLPDADTTDAESRNRARARAVVLRAIEAMGGMEALMAIRQVRVRVWVWVEAAEHVTWPAGPRGDPSVAPLDPFPFLVAQWQATDRQGLSVRPLRAEVSLDPARPNAPGTLASATRNPELTVMRYARLFEHRWGEALRAAPVLIGRRVQAESRRWHFVDSFLGEGIDLRYLGPERFHALAVEAIQVVDLRYGHYSEGFFSRRTGLLAGMREGLDPAEQRAFRDRHTRDNVPVWDTEWCGYRRLGAVLVPRALRRQDLSSRSGPVTVYLQTALNGAEPSPDPPALGAGAAGAEVDP
ncbi:MAG: hypothetical protein AB1505_15040 [Candidatus Latescibacterota bacterium]